MRTIFPSFETGASFHVRVRQFAQALPPSSGLKAFLPTLLILALSLPSCSRQEAEKAAAPVTRSHTAIVTATAYNATVAQTDGTPRLAAWQDTLKPGTRAIAVSRDLLAMGLGPGDTVQIVGLPGSFVVLDKMHSRWRKKIDVFFDRDLQGAKEFGERTVTLTWKSRAEADSLDGALAGEPDAREGTVRGGAAGK